MGAAPTPPRQPPSPKRLGLGLAALALLSASLLALQVFSVDDDVFSELLPPSVEDAWEEVLQRASHTQVRTLSFSVCNGFANQRLSLVFGLVIAKQLGRVVVLPQMLLNGMQTSDENREASDTPSSTPFEEFYDLQALRAALAPFHMRLLTHVQGAALPPSRSSANVTLAGSKPIESVVDHFALHQNRDHISMDCPALYLATGVVQAESKFIRAVLMGLRPSHTVEGYIRAAVERLGTFNFLHLRIERDWQAHCKRWAALSAMDGVVRDNCFNHTIDVHRAMTAMGFDRHVPVYIGSQWEQVRPRLVAESLSGMAAAGFTPIRSRSADSLPRELAALVDFELAMRAERFLGNSVSSFSALVILERHYRGLWAGYYNGGDIPLEQVSPA
ncbi:hypothetical protein Rsub_06894 [Raphidocelis subcapitata]|uniref:O-fucosyltransferase family protein n=1 Tax=Raphidocelis subcapitata TaxID=307507 RepID=A0A2V0P9W8_9CHLO|nr:hypothetical protein Rsub_06894 [Raphidocelis subcapitata]|eukprot:GBF93895.1 hypothetical protein Rsub_06894 [Raphidocelis subcapitata]